MYCKRKTTACYVKGRLQPTYAIGDFHLKYEEFNNPEFRDWKAGYKRNIRNFQSNYIKSEPLIYQYKLQKNDKLVMGTDGLWDELDNQKVLSIV